MPPVDADVTQSLSILALFGHADIIVKTVMILLIAASVWSWTIIIEKMVKLRTVMRQARAEDSRMRAEPAASPAPDAAGQSTPAATVMGAGWQEWHLLRAAQEVPSPAEQRERIERAMRLELSAEMRRLEVRLPFLATLGSAAPFIGLFGTVWGIMNSFTAIAASNNTSLAVVAPGIAEALFATATGLVAAIPAVIAYNKITVELGRFSGVMHGLIGRLGGALTRPV